MRLFVTEGELVDELDAVIEWVEAGGHVTITRDGAPVADLVPHDKPAAADLSEVLQAIRAQPAR